MWQDIVLFILQMLTSVALVPTLLGKDKPEKTTSLFTSFVLLAMAFIYLTMQLSYASASAAVAGILWMVLFFQQARK